jgi:hypothetical protein
MCARALFRFIGLRGAPVPLLGIAEGAGILVALPTAALLTNELLLLCGAGGAVTPLEEHETNKLKTITRLINRNNVFTETPYHFMSGSMK